MEDFNMQDIIDKALEEALHMRGNVNILIAGKTGVGKSTLINALFQGNLAATGQGRPVTMETREISKAGIPVKILDTRGLEIADYKHIINELEALIQERSTDIDHNKHIHLALLCIAEDSRRIEGAEIELVKMLYKKNLPTIAVITKARADQGFSTKVQQMLPEVVNVMRVRALREEFDDGHIIEPMGLKELVNLAMEVVPEGQQNAFVAAQQIDLELRAKRARIAVKTASGAAGLFAATPIPYADIALIIPAEVTMLATISVIFGLNLNKAFLGTLVTSSITGGVSALGRKALVAGFLKLIPGANIAGSVFSGTVAAAFTTMFGEAYIAALKYLLKDNINADITPQKVSEAFKEQLRVRSVKF